MTVAALRVRADVVVRQAGTTWDRAMKRSAHVRAASFRPFFGGADFFGTSANLFSGLFQAVVAGPKSLQRRFVELQLRASER